MEVPPRLKERQLDTREAFSSVDTRLAHAHRYTILHHCTCTFCTSISAHRPSCISIRRVSLYQRGKQSNTFSANCETQRVQQKGTCFFQERMSLLGAARGGWFRGEGQARIQDFGQGGQRSFDPKGALSLQFAQNRGFPLKLPANCMILKKSWVQGGPGPQGPPWIR